MKKTDLAILTCFVLLICNSVVMLITFLSAYFSSTQSVIINVNRYSKALPELAYLTGLLVLSGFVLRELYKKTGSTDK